MGCELVRLQERDAERIGVILGLDFIGEFQNRPRQFLMLHSHTVRKTRGVQPRVVHCHSLPLRPPRLLHSPANQPLLSLPRPFLPLSVVTPPPFSTSPPPPTPPNPLPRPSQFHCSRHLSPVSQSRFHSRRHSNSNAAPRNTKPKCSDPPNF